jgi:hypothetical protein
MQVLLGLLLDLLEKVGITLWAEYNVKRKVQNVANAPLTDKEEADDLLK